LEKKHPKAGGKEGEAGCPRWVGCMKGTFCQNRGCAPEKRLDIKTYKRKGSGNRGHLSARGGKRSPFGREKASYKVVPDGEEGKSGDLSGLTFVPKRKFGTSASW